MRRDSAGHSSLLDLNATIGVPSNAIVQTFHVEQSWSLKLFMVVAWREQSSTNSSGLIVLKPCMPDDLTENARLEAYRGDSKLGRVERIFMVSSFRI